MTAEKQKILVLGLGNPILSDDGVGIFAVRQAASLFQNQRVTFEECSLAGFGFLDRITGYDKLIIADAVQWQRSPPGTIITLGLDDLEDEPHLRNFHTLSLAGTLRLADEMSVQRPQEIVIFAVEAADCSTFSEQCTPEVQPAVLKIAEMIVDQIKKWLGS
ncbi:MAG: hydrogenase maturation protease [Candidatus Latescibacteria bacterium]|nr:hydrogenase maturation protease [Candidatus Latescibacterota bacterium]NIO27222.1 hydrogenase maturation protease [Candidatus Latescibacterota bacterium]NIO54746.1 hydrogenase maturation protease [Candidatus Latescibacterota bacterium]NIT00829.1 hydrogenase maturation protease [Candidatus Latescibacterota bacterium]NIT37752.1 hydrogenase maturation protease [Candidatus Latescibacterota bacterium]